VADVIARTFRRLHLIVSRTSPDPARTPGRHTPSRIGQPTECKISARVPFPADAPRSRPPGTARSCCHGAAIQQEGPTIVTANGLIQQANLNHWSGASIGSTSWPDDLDRPDIRIN
jgi:hypothetical protein